MANSSFARSVFLTLGFVTLVALAALIQQPGQAIDGRVSLEAASKLDPPRVRSSFSPKNKGDDAQSRHSYELMRLRDPETGRIPVGIRSKELDFVKNLPRAEELAAKTGRMMAETWTFRGPNNVGGRTRALSVDLNYNGTSNRRILAGGISGGVYLSEDDGQSWTLTTSLSDLASVTCLAQDPTNRNIWYHGTGELTGNSSGGGTGEFHGQGIFKSVDGGRTWAQLGATVDGSLHEFDNLWDYVWNVAVHPNGVVFAATFGGIFRSTDGGTSWEFVLGNDQGPYSSITDVEIAADGDVYATLSRNGSGTDTYGVFKSTDAGAQWQNVTPQGLSTDPYRMVLDSAPSDANTLYVLVQATQEGGVAGDHQLFRYSDVTRAWTNLSGMIPHEEGVDGNSSFSTQGGYDQMVRVKPDDANTVFIGGTNLYRSTDGGNSFTRIGGYRTPANYSQFSNHHSDQHALAFLPTNPNVALSGHDGGVSRSDDILDDPHNWTSLNRGYVTTQFYAVAMDPQPGSSLLIGGLQDNGTWGTETEDASTEWFELYGGDGAHAAIAPGGTALYVSSQNGNVLRMTSNTWTTVTPAGANVFMFINPLVLDPNDPRVMYMGENGGVWRNSNLDAIPNFSSEPTAVNWTFLGTSAQPGMFTTAVTAASTPANRIYFATTDFSTRSSIIRVDNAHTNASGTVITPPLPAARLASYPSAIAVNPENGDELIAVFSNYNTESIWHSTNAGATWRNLDGNLGGASGPSVRTAAIVPTADGVMYFVGTSTGVYSTTSPSGGTTTWALEGGGVLGNVVVDMLVARPGDGTIIAGTHGRGVYQARISRGGTAAVASLDVTDLAIQTKAGESGTTTFTLTNTGNADLDFAVGALGKTESSASKHQLVHDPTLRRPSDRMRLSGPGSPAPKPRSAKAVSGSSSALAGGDFIVLDDGSDTPDTYLGWGNGETPFQWGSSFYAPVGGFTLESFYVYMRSENAASLPVTVFISDPEGRMYVSGSVDLPVSSEGQWYFVYFDPIVFEEGEPFDIEIVTPAEIGYPAGVDMTALAPESGYYWVDNGLDGSYALLSEIPGFEEGAWLIRAEGTAGGASLNQPPTASFTASKSNVAVNESVAFDGSASRDPDGSIAQYAWDFGDGGSSAQQSPVHAFATPGVYTVRLTVTDDEGATGEATRQITVASNNQPPVARIQASKIQAQVNEAISFDGSGSSDPDGSIQQFAWTFGDGTTSNQPLVSHSYSRAGSYSVNLTVTDNAGATSRSSVRVDVVAERSRLAVSPTTGTLRPGESRVITVTYDATGTTAGNYTGLVNLSTNGGDFSIPVTVQVNPSTGTGTEKELPGRISLDQNYPNPFNPETTIRFTLDRPSGVRLSIYDMNGRLVRLLVDGSRSSGTHQVTWDGEDSRGNAVASGTYIYRIEAHGSTGEISSTITRKMTLLR